MLWLLSLRSCGFDQEPTVVMLTYIYKSCWGDVCQSRTPTKKKKSVPWAEQPAFVLVIRAFHWLHHTAHHTKFLLKVYCEMCRRSSQLNLKPKHGLWTHSSLNAMKLGSLVGSFERMQKPAVLLGKMIITGGGFGGGRLEMVRALLKRKAWSPDRLVTGCEWSTWVLWLSRRTPDSVWALKQCHHQRPGLTAI